MTPPLITSDQLTLGVTILYFAVIFGAILVVDYYLKNYQFFRDRFAVRVVVGVGVYVAMTGLLLYTVPPTTMDDWLHRALDVSYS